MEIKERIIKDEKVTDFDAGELLYCGMSLINYEDSGYGMKTYSDSEKEILNQWKQEVEKIFLEELQYSKEEMQGYQNSLYEEGYLSYDACRDEKETVLERIRARKR